MSEQFSSSATTAVMPPLSSTAAAARGTGQTAAVAMAQPDLMRFVSLMVQLGLLLAVFHLYSIEERAFEILSFMIVGGFAIHYWLPYEWKERFYIGWSLVGAFVMLPPSAAGLLILSGLLLFGIVALPIAFRWRIAIVGLVCAAAVYARATLSFGIPFEFWPVFGAIFMFRFMIYLYDASHAKTAPQLREFLTYFFNLPNYYFLLFPVIDFQTHRQTYFRRNINDVAQQGVLWIARGTLQLMLYRLVYQWKGPSNAPDQVTTFGALASTMILTYMLYLRVSGQFHIIIGFLHLFGYDLPETHRKYLLSRSLTDFWRRINIYWKDFMVKLVYFPVYFRLRRSGHVQAQVIATVMVFVTTWFLHAYQWFWLRGEFLLTWPDTLFWAILGALVVVNLLMEGRKKPARATASAWSSRLEPLKVFGTFCLIVTLWSLWNSPSVTEWLDLVTWWKLG
jgi:D-alanyl-lipoteichoic acid acyltransferase DltB (MBOAT superfamily)